ncbi:unnamed protein product [Mytilus edulis]|uniref:Integrase core domain-containing protein n=1 Tax=Mytilus edulis TaxID=6550 RepID=A0A8S3TTG4_MYTED|nr:unnamed protein product [Mytilus edulis]
MNRNSKNDEKDDEQNVRGLRKISYWEKYGVKRFPYPGRRRFTPSLYQSEDVGIAISNDVFGLTISQFERMYKACLDRRKSREQYIMNLRYPDKTSDEYMEYLQDSTDNNKDDVFWTRKDFSEVNVLRLVKRYFEMEFFYRDIVKILQMNHAISISLRQVKRKIIWLKVGRSSSNPKVIARYFIDAIEEHRGHPYSMRGDMGTENGLVAVMQTLFAGDEVTIPFIYGKSTMNTRIESWWGILRKKCCQVWISAMKGLQERGQFSGDKLDINLIQFCCMQLLQNELDDTAQVWNTHYIRRSREYVFHGRPVNMYLYPDLFNAEEHIRQVDDDVLHFCRSECAEEDEYPCEEEIFELGCIYMEENLLKPPENVDESVALYLSLRRWFIQQL